MWHQKAQQSYIMITWACLLIACIGFHVVICLHCALKSVIYILLNNVLWTMFTKGWICEKYFILYTVDNSVVYRWRPQDPNSDSTGLQRKCLFSIQTNNTLFNNPIKLATRVLKYNVMLLLLCECEFRKLALTWRTPLWTRPDTWHLLSITH